MNRSKEQIYYEDIVPLMSKIIDICEEHDIEIIGGSGFYAPAEREAEKPTVSAEPFGYFRVTPFGWEDCAATDDGAIPLYTAPQPDRVAELERDLETERMRLAACGTAALGYYDGCADEYRSASLDDVLRLRVEAERLRTLLSEAIRARDAKGV